MAEAPSKPPAFCTATTQDVTTCLNAWDVTPSCPGPGHDPSPYSQEGSSLAVAAAMQYRQLKQQQERKQQVMPSTYSITDPQAQTMPVTQAAQACMFRGSPSASLLAAADSSGSSGSGSGSSVSSLYGRLRSSNAIPQVSVSGVAAAAAAAAGLRRAGVRADQQLLGNSMPATAATANIANPISAAHRGLSSVDQTASTDMLSLLLAATHMSAGDAVDHATASNSAGYVTSAAGGLIPANTANVSITNCSVVAVPPGLLSMDTAGVWPNSSSAHSSGDADILQAELTPKNRLQLLHQLQQLQASPTLSATVAAQGAAQAMHAPPGMHAAVATPAAMSLLDYGDSMAFLQQQQYQQQTQVVPIAGLNTAAPTSSNAGMPTAVFYYDPAATAQAAPQAAAGPAYQMTAVNTASSTMQGMADAGFILPTQQQLQVQSGLSHNTAAGPSSVGTMGATAGNLMSLQSLQGVGMALGDAALLGSSSAGESSWQARADCHASTTAPHNPLYKTELCRSWLDAGSCRYGARCQFAHGQIELRPVLRPPKYKTQPCRTFSLTGKCPYGARCNFIHDEALVLSGLSSTILGGPSSTNIDINPAHRELTTSDGTAGTSTMRNRALSKFSTNSTACSVSVGGGPGSSNWQLASGAARVSNASIGTGHSRTSSITGLHGLGGGVQLGGGGGGTTAGVVGSDAAKDQLQALIMQLSTH